MSSLVTICVEFFLTGLFAMGGGLATIPFLMDMASQYAWFTSDTLSTMIAVSESTPGPMGINMATFVGYTVTGIPGALCATLSIVTPSVIIICIIANYFQKFKNSEIVKMVLAGIKPAVIAFIIAACSDMFVTTLFHVEALSEGNVLSFFQLKEIVLLMILLVVYHRYPKIHPIAYIVVSALIGMVFSL